MSSSSSVSTTCFSIVSLHSDLCGPYAGYSGSPFRYRCGKRFGIVLAMRMTLELVVIKDDMDAYAWARLRHFARGFARNAGSVG
jgi:hypothetical protein